MRRATKRFCGKDGVIGVEWTGRACSPCGKSARCLRDTELRSLYRQGLLAQWQQGMTLDDRPFRVASDIRMTGTNSILRFSASACALSQFLAFARQILAATPGAGIIP